MWNKRKEEDSAPRPTHSPLGPAAASREGIPMSTSPSKSFESDIPRGSGATIGKSVAIKGQVFAREDLIVDGEVDGSIDMPESRLTVGPNGKVNAGIKAREIVVLGTVLGNVEAVERIDIRKEAKLVGDIKTTRIVIEDGAYFKGSIDIVRQDAPKPVAVAQRAQAAAIGATAQAAAGPK
jgi:cytoskeletal protein CcmA (bactofilin family)